MSSGVLPLCMISSLLIDNNSLYFFILMMTMTDDYCYMGDFSGACVRGPMRRGGARSGARAVNGPGLQVRSAPGTRCQDHPLPCIRPR